jgi:hypothetical protein
MFKILGVLVLLYAVYAAVEGQVFAKSGPSGRMVSRDHSPEYFWVVVVIYGALGLGLLFLF